jgi:DNA-binding CsgD family transcriptional regulator
VAPHASYEELDERVREFDFEMPVSLEWLLDACGELLREGIVHTSHPRYFGLFNPTPTFAGVLADALAAAFNPQLAVTSHAPAAVAIERRVLSFLADRLGFADAVGTFTSGGAEANLTAVLVALERHFPEATDGGLAALGVRPTLSASTEAHHSLHKVARMTGLGHQAVRSIPPTGGLALDVAALRARIVRDRAAGERPFLVVATAGSTAAGVVDPLPAIADLCRELEVDLHVDAAWAGAACLSRRLRPVLDGIERADSVTIDAHKWLSAPMGAGMFFTRHRHALAQTFRTTANYMPSAETSDPYLSSAQVAGRLAEGDELIERALELTEDPLRRAKAQHLRGRGLVWRGEPAAAHALLTREADRVNSLSPGTAAMMLAEAVLPCGMIGDVPMTLETARAARTAAAGVGGVQEVFAAVALAGALQLNGEGREARELLQRQLPALRTPDALRAPGDLVATAAHGFVWLEDYPTAADLYDRVVACGREASSPAALPYALAGRSELGFRTGRWSNAVADATEAIELSEEMGQFAIAGWALACLAMIEAAYGQSDSCREHVDRGWRLAESTGAAAGRPFAGAALGLLELGLGHPDAAVAALEPVAQITEANGVRAPHIVHWAPDLVEALARLGRPEEAARSLDKLEGQARRANSSWALAATARCRGLLAGDDDIEQRFGEALNHHQRTRSPFERARTELCYGERLRRAGQRTRARTPLRAALTSFDRLGAEPWSDRARVELKATGERVRRRDPSARDRLTPHELQVAFLVADGATNREAAASLFVTSKTIEFHLGRIYRKLGVRSRTELSVRIRNGDPLFAHARGIQADA